MRRALVVLALVAAGCSGSGGANAAKPYGPDDIRWLQRLNTWQSRYLEQSQKVQPEWERLFFGGRGALRRLRTLLRPLRECSRSLEAKAGHPEHARLRRAYDLLLDVCENDRKYALALVESFGSTIDRGVPPVENVLEAERLFHEAFGVIEAGLLVNRRLAVRGGMSTESRIEPRLSRAAARLASKQVQVRCWSAAEWPRVLKEWDAYSGNASDLVGFASGPSRAHIDPEHCATLARFTYRKWRPAGSDGLEEAADAVELLAHETEHLLNAAASEAETECHAAQDVRRVARALGASPSYASRLSVTYWTQLYPFEDPEYQSKLCRNGGVYDRRLDTDVFP